MKPPKRYMANGTKFRHLRDAVRHAQDTMPLGIGLAAVMFDDLHIFTVVNWSDPL